MPTAGQLSYSDLFNTIDGFEDDARQMLGAYYLEAYNSIHNELKQLYAFIDEMEAKGIASNEWYTRIQSYKKARDRLASLLRQIEDILKDLLSAVRTNIIDFVCEGYNEGYNLTAYYTDRLLGFYAGFDILNTKQIERSFLNSIGGLVNYKDNGININSITGSIWSDREFAYIKYMINKAVTQGIIRGKSFYDTAKVIKGKIQQSFGRSLRITRTETMRAFNDAANCCWQDALDMGIILKKKWIATFDHRTRCAHRYLNGKLADQNGYFHYETYKALVPGQFGIARLDINCRCTFITIDPQYDENIIDTSNKFIKDTTYQGWLEARVA